MLLHGGGVPVTVPRAEAYAVHKLIVAVDRVNKAKSAKDIEQAQILIEALAVRRSAELADSWKAAWNAGPQWRKKLESGRARLSADAQAKLAELVQGTHPYLARMRDR